MAYGYINKLSNNVQRDHIKFHNRYQLTLAGDLYYAKDIDQSQQLPALIIGAPYGGVKEQGPAVYANGQPEYKPSFPTKPYANVDALPDTDSISKEWLRFYAVPRGFHQNARGNFTTTSNMAMMQFSVLDYIDEISPRPILFIFGDHAHSRSFSERAYDLANEPKEKYIVKDAEHIDLYDRVDKIPFAKLEDFFKKNLNK